MTKQLCLPQTHPSRRQHTRAHTHGPALQSPSRKIAGLKDLYFVGQLKGATAAWHSCSLNAKAGWWEQYVQFQLLTQGKDFSGVMHAWKLSPEQHVVGHWNPTELKSQGPIWKQEKQAVPQNTWDVHNHKPFNFAHWDGMDSLKFLNIVVSMKANTSPFCNLSLILIVLEIHTFCRVVISGQINEIIFIHFLFPPKDYFIR